MGDSITEAPTPSSTSASRSAGTAREKPQTWARGPAPTISSHGVPVVLRDAREAGLDPVDAELVEQPRDLELLLRIEDDADGLLAVTERRVVQPDAAAHAVRVVQAPVQIWPLNSGRCRRGTATASRGRRR